MKTRVLFGLAGLATACGLSITSACGSSDDGNADPPTGPNADGGNPTVDGGGDGAVDPAIDGPLKLQDRLMGWGSGYTGGFYPARGYAISKKRLFSMPDGLSSTLKAITIVDVSAPKAKVITLPVKGTVPSGTVEVFTYDPASDRIVFVSRGRQGTKIEIGTIAIGDNEATFSVLTQAGTINKSNSMMGPLYATGAAGVLVVGMGNYTATLTISGTTATWPPESEGTIFVGIHATPMEDPAKGRVLAFGNPVWDPIAKTNKLEPAIRWLSLAPPYNWTALPFSGAAPDTSEGFSANNFTVYDAQGNRVIVSARHDSTCLLGQAPPCKAIALHAFDLNSNQWSMIQDNWYTPHARGGGPYLVQQEARRMLEPVDGVLVSTPLHPSNPTLAQTTLEQDGDLGPMGPSFATVLGDGRIVSGGASAFRVLDPKEATPRWTRHGTATIPHTFVQPPSVSADTKTNELVLFGTPRDNTNPKGITTEVHVVSSDGKKVTKVTTATTPPPRAGHAALVADGTLYVVGGMYDTKVLDDVWAFDRASTSWTKIATLPGSIVNATLAVGPNDELLVSGRTPYATGVESTPAPIYAVNRKTKAVRSLDATPTKYPLWNVAPYRGCFLGYESGDTVDGSGPTMWRCEVADGKIKWTSTKLDEHDFVLRDLRGTSSPDGLHAYFIGSHLWEVIGR